MVQPGHRYPFYSGQQDQIPTYSECCAKTSGPAQTFLKI